MMVLQRVADGEADIFLLEKRYKLSLYVLKILFIAEYTMNLKIHASHFLFVNLLNYEIGGNERNEENSTIFRISSRLTFKVQ